MNRLDIYDRFPSGFQEYLGNYGWHFSKKLCEHAVSKMEKEDANGNKKKLQPYTREQVEQMLKQQNIELKNNKSMYDAVYVANMAKADYLGSSIAGEQYVAKFVKDYLDDPDGYDGIALTRYYADCTAKAIPMMWEDYL